jgi:hypothetical protein
MVIGKAVISNKSRGCYRPAAFDPKTTEATNQPPTLKVVAGTPAWRPEKWFT